MPGYPENKNGEPVAVGVNFTAKSLENLPSTPANYVFILPKNKGRNFYTHVLLDWNALRDMNHLMSMTLHTLMFSFYIIRK